jgi:hypothetical protein
LYNIPGFGATDAFFEWAGGYAKILWKDSLSGNLRKGPKRVQEAAWATAQYMAPRVESYMKINAPWTDRTGNARNGLAARAYRDQETVGIVLFHQVPYGIWLETRWDGAYAIINPTIDQMGPEVMRMYERLLDRM